MSRCKNCQKPPSLCFCDQVQALETKTRVLILQHPQEPKEALSTAALAHLALANSKLRVGLSWKNLKAAWGEESAEMAPSEWLVLYFGTGSTLPRANSQDQLLIFGKDKKPDPRSADLLKGIRGLILLDGTWSQAKALWWRNPWLLKVKRGVLIPSRPSLYGRLRKEPKRECLSTLEAAAYSLGVLGERPNIQENLIEVFRTLLARYQQRRDPRARPPQASSEPDKLHIPGHSS